MSIVEKTLGVGDPADAKLPLKQLLKPGTREYSAGKRQKWRTRHLTNYMESAKTTWSYHICKEQDC